MAYIYSLADTWNASGTVFTAIKMNVTDTASAAGSLLMDLQVGGTSRFKVDKAGAISVTDLGTRVAQFNAGSPAVGLRVTNADVQMVVGSRNSYIFQQAASYVRGDFAFSWSTGITDASTTADLSLFRDAANTLAQRNGVNAQAFNLYQSYTDASNYTRGRVAAASGIVTIAGESAGTGATDIDIALTPKGTGRVRYGTHAAIAAETVTGYIEIKDAGGTVRKIAVVS